MNREINYGKKQFRYVDRVVMKLENKELIRIAGDNEVTQMLCDSDGCPFLPGTSIAGSIRSYILEHDKRRKDYGYFFGVKQGDKTGEHDIFCDSKLYFYDSPVEGFDKKEIEDYLESRTEIQHDGKNGGAKEHALHTMRYLKKGLSFCVKIEAFSYDKEEHNQTQLLFREIWTGIDSGEILFGSRKNNGCGKMRCISSEGYVFDLQKRNDFIEYACEKEIQMKLIKLFSTHKSEQNVTFTLEAKIKDALLIKTETGTKHLEKNIQAADAGEKEQHIAASMKSGEDFIIPGSSIKGVLRGYCAKISNTLDIQKEIVTELFGSSPDEKEERKAGRVRVSDCIIETGNNAEEYELIYHRIKIDRFTGGVMNGTLVTEKPLIKGKVNIQVTFKKLGDKRKDRKAFVLLYLCLRDIGLGKIPFGSNGGIGFGRLTGIELLVKNGNTSGNIQFASFAMDNWIRDELEKGFAILKEERIHENKSFTRNGL